MSPKFNEEKKLWKKGFKRVACLDEAGRGPLCGPVVAAAVMMSNPKLKILNSKQYQNSKSKNLKHRFRILNFGHLNFFRTSDLEFRILLKEVKDSKKLSPKKREKLYKLITEHPNIGWGIGRVSEKVIDRINIKNAAELAMEKALRNLEKKIGKQADFLIIDGNHLNSKKLKARNCKLIIKADEKVFSCALASILAKVTRDKIMRRYHQKYLQYGFSKHKGYPTKYHFKMLKKYGPCKIHRKSFAPLKACKKK